MVGGKPDEIDLRILALLQKNGRIDIQQLSGMVNLSRTPVQARIDKLEDAGVIKGYTALLDREKAGCPTLVITHIKLEKQTTELLEEFERAVSGMQEIQFCLHVSGTWNFILHVTASSPQAYFKFLMEQISSINNVAHIDSCFVMKESKANGPIALFPG